MKKYYLKKSFYRYVVLLWLSMITIISLFLIPFAIFIYKDTGDNFGWFLAGVMIAMMLLNIPLTILNIYIAISEKGIRYKMYVRTVKVKWEDIEGVFKSNASGIFKNQEGLILTNAEMEQTQRNILFPPQKLPQIFIPLSWFSENWRDSEIGQQIKQYAPHLFI